MLRGIAPQISPELLKALAEMGHSDEIVISDAFFPASKYNDRIIRADGLKIPELLAGILPLITLDSYIPSPVLMMQPGEGDELDPTVEASYRAEIDKVWPETPATERIGRFEFYERAKSAFCVVVSGETAKYGNVILSKGVINR